MMIEFILSVISFDISKNNFFALTNSNGNNEFCKTLKHLFPQLTHTHTHITVFRSCW